MSKLLATVTINLYSAAILTVARLLLCCPALLLSKAYWAVFCHTYPIGTSAWSDSSSVPVPDLLVRWLTRAWQAVGTWEKVLRPLGFMLVVLVRLFGNDERGIAARLEM